MSYYECPGCKSTKLKVVSTAVYKSAVYRQRRCKNCALVFETVEKLSDANAKLYECPECKSLDFQVLDTRSYASVVIRLRRCKKCNTVFETSERVTEFKDRFSREKRYRKKEVRDDKEYQQLVFAY